MIGLDTNVLVRLMVLDDKKQAEQALRTIKQLLKSGNDIYISHIVICELLWVLRFTYRYSKLELITALQNIILSEHFTVEDDDLIGDVFEIYQYSKADFADILIAMRNQKAGCKHTITFDKVAAKVKGFKKLG